MAGGPGRARFDPPLLDLAYEQVDHFQVRSDYRTSMTFSAIMALISALGLMVPSTFDI